MTSWIVEWSVKFRRIVVILAVGLLIYGIVAIPDVKRDMLPEFSPTTVEVQTEALGLSAAEVERFITTPLEHNLFNGVAFLETIESASLPGLSSVVMTFEPGTDLLDARQVVAERLTQAGGLPRVGSPPQMVQPVSSTSRVSMVSLESDSATPIEISVLARWVVAPRLLAVKGVANVSIWGFRDRQLQVLVDPVDLADKNVTLGQVIATTGNALEVSPLSFLQASSPGTGGFIDTINQRLHVFHQQAISTADQLAKVPVEGPGGASVLLGGTALTLGDVAEITFDHQPLIGDARCSDGPCLILVIEKFPKANTPEVAAGIKDALDALRPGLGGIEIDTAIYQPAAYIETAVHSLRTAGLIGGLLLLLVMVALRLDWRMIVVATASIATSMTAAVLVLLIAGATFTAMTVAGLLMGLALVVGDSVLGVCEMDSEDLDRRTAPSTSAIADAAARSRSGGVAAALVAAAAVMPVVALPGVAGAFLKPIAAGYVVAIAVALMVALVLTPALRAILLQKPTTGLRRRPTPDRHRRRAAGARSRILVALSACGVLLAGGLVTLPFLSQSLRPSLKERDVLVQLEAPPGTSLGRMDAVTATLVDELRAVPGVDDVGAHVGRAIMSDQVVDVNSGLIWVNIGPSADYGAAMEGIEAAAESQNEIVTTVQTYSDLRVTDVLGRPESEIVVRIYGEDPEIRRAKARELRGLMEGITGVDDLTIEMPLEEKTIEIQVDLDRAHALGIKPGDVRRRAATLLSGIVVGSLFEEQKVFDVVVWGVPSIRRSLADIENLLIDTPDGTLVPLREVADVRIAMDSAVIRHESATPYLDVTANAVDRDATDIAEDIDAALAQMSFPLEHHAEVLGGFIEARAARSRVIAVSITALIAIYLLLQATFNSWRLATLTLLVIPIALSGGLLAVLATGRVLTLGSVAGLAAIVGLAARGVILVVRRYQEDRWLAGASRSEWLAGPAGFVKPMVISAAAVAGFFAPFALSRSSAGFEIVGPMAIVILGGVVTTLLLVLVVLPPLCARWVEPPSSHDAPVVEVQIIPAPSAGQPGF